MAIIDIYSQNTGQPTGLSYIPKDSGMGGVFRPFGVGDMGSPFATLETLWDFFIDNVPDPDWVLRNDPHFDEKLRQQPEVHSAMRIRELTVASLPVDIIPSKARGIDRQFAQKVANYVTDVIEDMPHRREMYRTLQNAVLMGGQGLEMIWQRVDGFERPVSFVPTPKDRFVFDRIGRMALLTRQYPVWGVMVANSPNYMRTVPKPISVGDDKYIIHTHPGKFIYHTYTVDGGSWRRPAEAGYYFYGRGEDTFLYFPVTFDQFVLRFQMKWLQKHGMPLSILYYPETGRMPSEVLRIAESIREESVVRMPRPSGENKENFYYKLDFQEPPSAGYDAFADFHDRWTAPRVDRILLGGAQAMQNGEIGSYSANESQKDSGQDVLFRNDAHRIDETMSIQLIPTICQMRWPGLPERYYPRHKMAPDKEEDRMLNLEILEKASQMVPVRESDVYAAAGLVQPKEGEPTVNPGAGMGGDEFGMFPPTSPGGKGKPAPPPGKNGTKGAPAQPPQKPTKPGQRAPIGRSPTTKNRK